MTTTNSVRTLRTESLLSSDNEFERYGKYWIIALLNVLFLFVPLYSHALSLVFLLDDSVDIKNRMEIQAYLEKAMASHPNRDKKLLAEFWSVATPDTSLCNRNRWVCGNYKPYIQTYWETTLRKVYKKYKDIRVEPKEINIIHHPLIKWVYGVTLHLDIKGKKYSDSGYMFMVWDFRNIGTPQILIRTWQPEYINKEKGLKFNPDDVFNLADFDF